MSDSDRPPKVDGYFSVECDILKLGTTVPFDCFIHLELNNRVVHWLREGSVFSPAQVEKLEKFGRPRLFIMNMHADAYQKYAGVAVGDKVAPTPEMREEPPPKSGHIRIENQEPMSSGSVRTEEPPDNVHIFGRTIIKPERRPRPAIPMAAESAPEPKKSKVTVDVDFINVVIQSTQTVIGDVCKVKVTPRQPTTRKDKSDIQSPIGLASFIGLNSQTIRGTIGLCFPTPTYLYLLNSAIGVTFSSINAELALGAGEFMYHIFSVSCPNLIELGYSIDRAAPFWVMGEDIAIPHVLPDPGFSIIFDSPGGPFQFEIGIKTGK